MRRKWISIILILLVLSVMGTSACDSLQPPVHTLLEAPIGKSLDETAKLLNQQLLLQEIQLESYAKQVEATLSMPKYQQFAVNTTFQIIGEVRKYEQLTAPYAWVEMEYEGKPTLALPSTFQTYVPIQKGRFSEKIRLFAGEGKYKVTVRLPSLTERGYYVPFTTFEVINVNPTVQREISLSAKAKQAGLRIESPLTGYTTHQDAFLLSGRYPVAKGKDRLLLQVSKGNQTWKKLIAVTAGRFEEQVPLLFGKGIHEIQLMIPEQEKKDYFSEGAILFVDQVAETERSPIQYTNLYQERGVHLITPVAGGDSADLTYRIAGTIDPTAKDAAKTDHLIVQTLKGKEKATYFIPVRNYHFDSQIWLRFGAGEYQVNLFVPEVTEQQRAYFRFYSVASFSLTSRAKQDLRNLLPSRGIESNHSKIKQLAHKLTGNKKSDREKAEAIYRYVAQTMRYDDEKMRKNGFEWDDSSLKALSTRSGVCQDFSFLTIALLRSVEIPARFVEGVAGGQRHAWVEAWIGDRWLTMDPTWGAGYLTPKGEFVRHYDPKYFDPPTSTFNQTHKRTGVVY